MLAFFDAFAADDLDAAERLYTEDATITMPPGATDLAGHRALGAAFRAAFPDSHMEVALVIEDGDTVVVEGTFVGTHTGDLVSPDGTIPASGAALALPFAEVYRMEGSLIAEQRTYWDQAAMLGQLTG